MAGWRAVISRVKVLKNGFCLGVMGIMLRRPAVIYPRRVVAATGAA
jgi:hypothetical protein